MKKNNKIAYFTTFVGSLAVILIVGLRTDTASGQTIPLDEIQRYLPIAYNAIHDQLDVGEPEQEYRLLVATRDEQLGWMILRFNRYYRNFIVRGEDIVVNIDLNDQPRGVYGRRQSITVPTLVPLLPERDALDLARKEIWSRNQIDAVFGVSALEIIAPLSNDWPHYGEYRLAYRAEFLNKRAQNNLCLAEAIWFTLYLDAEDGKILFYDDHIRTFSPLLEDGGRPTGGTAGVSVPVNSLERQDAQSPEGASTTFPSIVPGHQSVNEQISEEKTEPSPAGGLTVTSPNQHDAAIQDTALETATESVLSAGIVSAVGSVVAASPEELTVFGTKSARLFGIIPVQQSVTASVDLKTGEVEVLKKPWWSIFAR